jgi:hypothetical protein
MGNQIESFSKYARYLEYRASKRQEIAWRALGTQACFSVAAVLLWLCGEGICGGLDFPVAWLGLVWLGFSL